MKRVVIHVTGGVADVVELPEGVEVEVRDFDDESDDREVRYLNTLEDGRIIQQHLEPLLPVKERSKDVTDAIRRAQENL